MKITKKQLKRLILESSQSSDFKRKILDLVMTGEPEMFLTAESLFEGIKDANVFEIHDKRELETFFAPLDHARKFKAKYYEAKDLLKEISKAQSEGKSQRELIDLMRQHRKVALEREDQRTAVKNALTQLWIHFDFGRGGGEKRIRASKVFNAAEYLSDEIMNS